MNKKITSCLIVLISFTGWIKAQVPGTLSYQGILLQADGSAIADGSHSVVFNFYTTSSGGAATLTRTISVMTVKGLYTCVIGDGSTSGNAALPASVGSQQLYIGISVDAGSELLPRAQLTSSPYSFQAQSTYTMDAGGLTGTVAAARIAAGAIDNTKLASGIDASKITTGTLTGSLVGTGISASNVTTGTLNGNLVGTGINAGNITTGTFNGSLIGSGTVNGSLVGTGINATNVTNGTLNGGLVGTGINGGNITSGTISGSRVGSGISASNITTGSMSGSLVNPSFGAQSLSVSLTSGIAGNFFSNNNYGIYASSNLTDAGHFVGSVTVTNGFFVTGGTKSFKIDHPLDPSNKYLIHAAIESNEVMNLYDGIAELNEKGEAKIIMPDWFEALNRDFRYQLTCIGGFAEIFVEEEIKNNSFKIAGGKPGMRVSWQVTGIRNDPFIKEHPMQVELEKKGVEKGKYLNPREYGLSETLGINYQNNEKLTAQNPKKGIDPKQ